MNTIILIADCSLTAAGLVAALARLEQQTQLTQLVLFEIKSNLSPEPSLQDALADIAKSLKNFLTCPKIFDKVCVFKRKMVGKHPIDSQRTEQNGPKTAITTTNDMNKSRGPP